MSIICSDNKRTGCGQNLSDLVKLLGEVVHPVSNNSLPDELALAFKPSILIISLISLWMSVPLTNLGFSCLTHWPFESCQISCAHSTSAIKDENCLHYAKSTCCWLFQEFHLNLFFREGVANEIRNFSHHPLLVPF